VSASGGTPAPVLVFAVGNPSRGDDALGPQLAARLEAEALPGVEVITEFQLQVEHALDLAGRACVIFIDAGTGTRAPFELARVEPAAEFLHTSHALQPAAVLATYRRVTGGEPPEAWLLCVRGESFELGEALTAAASRHAEAAWAALLEIVRAASVSRD
jgi:hydrogenase maturation protease